MARVKKKETRTKVIAFTVTDKECSKIIKACKAASKEKGKKISRGEFVRSLVLPTL